MTFSSNGVDQRQSDLVARASVRGSYATNLSGRTQVAAAEINQARCVHIIFDGQSTNNNAVTGGAYTPTNASSIFNMSLQHRGAVFLAKDPLLSSDIVESHHGLRLADMLITAGTVDRVLLTNLSFGGSYAADHCPGGGVVGGALAGTSPGDLAYNIGLVARTTFAAGFWNMKTIIDWQQGEWDTDTTATTQSNYQAAMQGVVNEYKRQGLLRTGNVMFVNQCTRISAGSTPRNAIRAAQAAVCDAGLVRLGFDVDTLTGNRPDGTHFDGTGANLQAAGKLPFHTNFILNG